MSSVTIPVATAASPPSRARWLDANHRYLCAAIDVVRAALQAHVARVDGAAATSTEEQLEAARHVMEDARQAMPTPSALDAIVATFHLSSFERQLLVLCAALEFDAAFAALCATAQGDPLKPYPTFGLALAALPEAHWSALTPGGPLRRWRLIEVGTGPTLTTSPLRLDESVLHALTGVRDLDDRLSGLLIPVTAGGDLTPSHRIVTERVAAVWSGTHTAALLPVIQLCGDDAASVRTIAATSCATMGLTLYYSAASALPATLGDLRALLRLWEREAALLSSAWLLEYDGSDEGDEGQRRMLSWLIERTQIPLLVSSRERPRLWRRPAVAFDVAPPTADEQRLLWRQALGSRAETLNGSIDRLVMQFQLNSPTIVTAATEARATAGEESGEQALSAALWTACRIHARPRLDDLAQRIEPAATWADLVLPDQQRETLAEIAIHVRQRATVYTHWGFAAKGTRGLGISALFAGPSGTGKTTAAEVLANELQLDLYRIDLSSVVSKYIGETEKNLRRVFDAPDEGGAILLFDEADALFGKRSEVKDSHDRYANIEVGYLLQRMETYRGLAVLTTNLKNALDTAFLRRIRFVVPFPFPDAAQRAEIWRRIFPSATPTHGLDTHKLSRLNIPGGNIRNIALHAAFLAAEAGEPVRMAHLQRATRTEYAKMEKTLTLAEIDGWD